MAVFGHYSVLGVWYLQLNKMTKKNIEDVVLLFQKVGVWNNGKFYESVKQYCEENKLDFNLISSKLEIAFRDVLATNIQSENAIRLRLEQAVLNNIAL